MRCAWAGGSAPRGPLGCCVWPPLPPACRRVPGKCRRRLRLRPEPSRITRAWRARRDLPVGLSVPSPLPTSSEISALEIRSREGTLVFLKLEAEFWLDDSFLSALLPSNCKIASSFFPWQKADVSGSVESVACLSLHFCTPCTVSVCTPVCLLCLCFGCSESVLM